jgi:hypothetical protein
MAMSTLRAFALAAGFSLMLAQPSRSAEALLSCVWQSRGADHGTRTFDITFDQHDQRAHIAGNESLPATISDTQISFSVNISGSVFQYVIDRTTGFGTLTISDKVMYSGMCKAAGAEVAYRAKD